MQQQNQQHPQQQHQQRGGRGRGSGGYLAKSPHPEHAPSTNLFINYIPAHVDEAALEKVITLQTNGIKPLSVFVMRHLDTKQSKGYAFALLPNVQYAMQVKGALDGYQWDNKRLQVKFADAPSSGGKSNAAAVNAMQAPANVLGHGVAPPPGTVMVLAPDGSYFYQAVQPGVLSANQILQQQQQAQQQQHPAQSHQSTASSETNLYIKGIPPTWGKPQLQQFFNQFGAVEDCAIMMDQGKPTGMAFVEFADNLTANRVILECNGKIVEPSACSIPLHIRFAKRGKSAAQQAQQNRRGNKQQQAPAPQPTSPPCEECGDMNGDLVQITTAHNDENPLSQGSNNPLGAGGMGTEGELSASQSSTNNPYSVNVLGDPFAGVRSDDKSYYSQRSRNRRGNGLSKMSFGPLLVHDPYASSRYNRNGTSPEEQQHSVSSPIPDTYPQQQQQQPPLTPITTTTPPSSGYPTKVIDKKATLSTHSCIYCKNGTSVIMENMPYEATQCDMAVRKLLASSGTLVLVECIGNGQAIATFAEHVDAVQAVQLLATSPHSVALLDCTQLEPTAIMGDFI